MNHMLTPFWSSGVLGGDLQGAISKRKEDNTQKAYRRIMRSNRIVLLIINVLLDCKLIVGVVDALLPVDVSVRTRVFNKSHLGLRSSQCTDSSVLTTSVFFPLSFKRTSALSLSSPSPSSEDSLLAEKEADKKRLMRRKRSMYSFSEARKLARGHGFASREEFLDYDCPGAYQLPKNADEVWSDDWTSWEDFLGVPIEEFETAREIARSRLGPNSVTSWKASSETEYRNLFKRKEIEEDDIASRLPYRPDLKYKKKGWVSWEDFLVKSGEE